MESIRRSTASPLRSIRSITPIKQSGVIARDLREFLLETFRYNNARISTEDLRRISRTIPFKRALRRIGNGVLAMPWTILPPKDLLRDIDALETAKRLIQALKKPNREEHNLYSKFIRAIINELICLGVAAVERHAGDPSDPLDQPFWLFLGNAANIRLNPNWTPQLEGIEPRFYDFGERKHQGGIPIYAQHMFLIQQEASTHELIPPSPLEIAYHMIQAWLGLGEFQSATTTQAVREYILVLKGADQNDVEAFREYWEAEVEGSGKIPIVGGEGIQVEKLGARNDEELYLRYTDYILRIIAVAFDLSNRDFGIVEHDNRATAGVAADTVFQDAVLPMALCIREHLEMEVIDYYYPGFRLEITDTEPRSQEQEAATASNLFKERVISRNEARLRSGHDALPGDDVFADGQPVPTEEDIDNSPPDPQNLSTGQNPDRSPLTPVEAKRRRSSALQDKGAIAQQLKLF